MSDFAVTHCSFGQADVFAAGVDEGVWVFRHEHVIGGDVCLFYGVGLVLVGVGVKAPSVTDDEYEWFSFKFRISHTRRPLNNGK